MTRSTLIIATAALIMSVASYNIAQLDAQWDAKALSVVSAAEAAPAPKQVLDTDELMKMLIDPIFDDVKAAIETAPVKRKDWRSLYMAASNLAEVNNLLYLRHDEDYMATKEWTTAVVQAQTANNDLAAAVKDRAEFPLLKEKFMLVMQSCNDCHSNLAPDAEVSDIEGPAAW